MASQCRVLIPVFWRKNFLYLRFNWIPLCLIFLFLTFCNVAYLHWTDNTSTIRMEIFESKDYVALKQLYFPANDDDKIYYAPSTENARSLVDQVRTELELPYERMLEYNSSDEMQMDMEQRCRGNCFAINFQEMPAPGDDGSFRYTLSSNQMRSLPEKRFVNDEQINHAKDDDEYIRNGFLTLQLVIDRQYMRYQRIDNNYELLLKSMPNLELSNADSNRINNSGTLFSIFFTFLLLSTFVVPYVEEKHNGIKAFLNLVTPMSFLDGLTFFSIRFFCYAFFLTITLIPAYYYHALGNSGIIFAVFLYLLYIVAQMSYAYLISVCFHSVFYAKIGGLVLFIIPYAFTFVRSWISKLACYFLCTNAFLEGLDVLQTFSNKHRELSGSDLFRIIKFDSSRLFSLYILLIFQTILYAVLYNYFACVFPGHGGLKRPLFFFLNPETYKKRQRNEYTTSPRGTDAIIISDLCKKFQSSKRETTIAQNLDMTIRNKEITVLLGHNGAGKTTIMNMIMGIVPKDSGKIIACSERDVASYRHLIGFCPQHSVFMNYMTCQQHLEFFAQLRGASRQDARLWAKEKLRKLNLTDKTNEYGCNLSGGMKRRLSLGIAIAGNTKIVILDEPSSGLDIESRRELWDILLALRKEKAILVTTHYMEEAEVLGDTICILVDGQLKANGSPLELKRKSGCGYFLKLQAHETKFLQQETLDLISNHIPNPIIQNIVKPTVYICLPYDYQKEFFNVLRSLEENMKRLGIETISITDTSLETVFLNCAGEADQVDTPDARARNDAPLLNYKRLQAPPSQWQLWRAIFYKKSTFLLNQWQYTCLMLSLPVIAVICVLFLMHSLSVVTNEAALPLKLSQLHTGTVYIYNPTGHHDKIEQQLRQYIEANGINAKTLTLRGSNSMHDELLQLQRENLADFLEDTIGVVDMYVDQRGTETTPTFELYYASNRYHSSVMLINMLDTCLLQLGKRDNQMQIEAIYVPIRRFVRDVSSSRLEYYPVIISAALFFSLFYYTSLPFREHVNGFRQLQPMSRYTYWFASFAMDALLHCGLCLILYIIQRIIMPSELYSVEEQGMIGFSFFFYGISYLPILYLLANNFKSISTISTYLLLMLIVSEIAPLITSNHIQAMKLHATKISFLRFLPDFNLNHQLRIINENLIAKRGKSKNPPLETTAIFFLYAIMVCVLVMGFFVIVLEQKYYRKRLREFFQWQYARTSNKSGSPARVSTTPQLELKDVQNETLHVKHLLEDPQRTALDNPLIVSNLRKSYNDVPVVNCLSFRAERGECFGLLGVNGAGKTSTFQMIAANLAMDGGRILIDGVDIRENEVAYRQRFGYCPQYDALNKFMTAEQCLTYMAMLRGLSGQRDQQENVKSNVDYWLTKMHLEKYRHVQVRNYSGGTKRKLLAAMAMIGAPLLVLLDEPTTGVDPISRRFLWQCIKDFQSKDRTVVLTSHSMDECEELCNRLAIMAKGKFKCLNNICELKRLSGFTIKLKMKMDTETEANVSLITSTLKSLFDTLDLRENHAGTLTYFVKTEEHILWSNVFKITNDYLTNQLDHLIEYYSVNECTLEDIFLKFDKQAKSLSRENSEVNEV